MFAYIIKSSILLAILYGSFALLLSRETFHRFNRLALLGVLVASMLLPAIELNIQKPSYLCYEEAVVPHVETTAVPTQDIEQNIASPQPILPSAEEMTQVPTFRIDIMQIVICLYCFGLLASLVIFFMQIFRL